MSSPDGCARASSKVQHALRRKGWQPHAHLLQHLIHGSIACRHACCHVCCRLHSHSGLPLHPSAIHLHTYSATHQILSLWRLVKHPDSGLRWILCIQFSEPCTHCSIARRPAWCNVCSSLDSPSPHVANLPPLPDPLVYLILYSSMRLVQKHVHCCSRRWLAHFCLIPARSAPLLIKWNVLHRSICNIDSIIGSVYY